MLNKRFKRLNLLNYIIIRIKLTFFFKEIES